jgi:squalene-hopene/tetraprenyl-beta-curcumene cyclase
MDAFMSFTGAKTDAGIDVAGCAGEGSRGVVRRADDPARGVPGGPHGRRGPHPARDHDHDAVSRGIEAAGLTARWLVERQADDGHWRGPLEGDTILESEYILIVAWADRLGDPAVAGCARRILREQLPGGGWAIYPGGPVDVSASVKAYMALKLTGHGVDSEPLRRARVAIREAGGPWAVNSFTRFYLALLGQIPYAACPAVPPEMVLLPDWFPVNLRRVSAWSRTMIVPLSLMWAFKPVRVIPADRGIAELFQAGEIDRPPPTGGTGRWDRFFRGVDRVMKACDAIGIRPLRSRAVQACRRWMLERFDGSDGLGAIFPPIVWSIVALRAVGCADDAPEVQECWIQLHRLVERETGDCVRIEPCRSPVWDTAISLRALADAQAAGCGDGVQAQPLDAAVDWLLANEIRTGGDWRDGVAGSHRHVAAAGWCFQYANRFYPDIDDTAMVLIAFATWRQVAAARGSVAQTQRAGRVEAAVRRALAWVEAMQNSDGGWAAFDRDNTMELLCKVPFADHNAMIDPSTPDIAGRVLEALGRLGLRCGHPTVDRCVAYLRKTQEADGAWFGRWGVNYIYGTWQVLEGLRAVGLPGDDPAVCNAAQWLVSKQQSDGGWGESPASYADESQAGVGEPTASQTAWAVAGLVAAGHGATAAAGRGVDWLVKHQEFDGSWHESEFTGTGFPKVFYLRYHYYPIYFPLMAMSRWCLARQTAVESKKEMVA